MTQDEYEVGTLEDANKFAIIRMAQEAGFYKLPVDERLERFATLIAAHERENLENDYPAHIPYTDEELEEAKTLLLKAKSVEERFAFIWETIYDHGNGKHLGALSRAQREVAWFYLQQIQDLCKASEAAVLAEREAIMDEWWMCVDSDLENGVKSLNERAAKKWHEEYPAISGFGEAIRARGKK